LKAVVSINLLGKSGIAYAFDGPYRETASLKDTAGIYRIVDEFSGRQQMLDVGESRSVKSRVEGHRRRDCWTQHRRGTIMCAVLYTPYTQRSGRGVIEQDICANHRFPCGAP
jgi:hypothetical protein